MNGRFELTADFTDPFGGYYHPKGETGAVTYYSKLADEALVEFDGYEDVRQQEEEFAKRYGEAMNCSPRRTVLPLKLIRMLG